MVSPLSARLPSDLPGHPRERCQRFRRRRRILVGALAARPRARTRRGRSGCSARSWWPPSLLFWWRIWRGSCAARAAARRSQDYLLGVEQALHGDLRRRARAADRRCVADDPENHYARLLLGKVLAELGEPAQAHQQHLYLQRAFGVDSAENDLLLAQSLLGAGMAREAADAAERALQRAPERAPAGSSSTARACRPATSKRRRAGRQAPARPGARRRRQAPLARRPRAHAGAGRHRAAARAAMRRAAPNAALQQAAPHRCQLRRCRRCWPRASKRRQRRRRRDRARAARRARGGCCRGAPARSPPMRASSAVVDRPRAACRWRRSPASCRRRAGACRASAARRCRPPSSSAHAASARDTADLLEPGLLAAVDSPTHTMDAIDENDAHVQRLVRLAARRRRPRAWRATARAELLDLRERAVEELLRQAWHRSGPEQEAAIDVLRAMGPTVAPSLFAASDALEQQRLLPIGSRSPAAVVGRIVQGFDRKALPHVGPLFSSARPEHRKILIDFFLGLADLGEFQLVLERFPPLEILHRFNKADGTVLRRFLQALPPGHFVAESLLLEPTFYREDEVLAAIPGARHPEVLERALLRRGPTRTLTKALIAALADAELAASPSGCSASSARRVLDHVLAAFTDPERGRRRTARGSARCSRMVGCRPSNACVRASAPSRPRSTTNCARCSSRSAIRGGAAAGRLRALRLAREGQHRPDLAAHQPPRADRAHAAGDRQSRGGARRCSLLAESNATSNLRLRLQQALHELGGAGRGRTTGWVRSATSCGARCGRPFAC